MVVLTIFILGAKTEAAPTSALLARDQNKLVL